jgi:hypothetical protein
MSRSPDDRTIAKLRDGVPLTRDEERHVATCPACQRARGDADRLDGRLRDAAGMLAEETLPADLLEAPPLQRPFADRMSLAPELMAAAAVVGAVAVGIAVTQVRPPVAVEPSPSAAASSIATPSVSQPATLDPTPSPSPTTAEPHAYVIGPGETCADGIAGYSVQLPASLYANRRFDESPACRTFGPVNDVGRRTHVDPRIYVGAMPQAPTFADSTIEQQEAVTLENGIVIQRYVTYTPETGALAAEHEVTYVTPLIPVEEGGYGGFLVASTDAQQPEWLSALDELMQTLALQPTMQPDTLSAAAAGDLFIDRDVCQDEERGLAVVFPDAWWTNTAVDGLPACSYFAPSFFEIGPPQVVPDEVEISLRVKDDEHRPAGEPIAMETLTLLERPAVRRETDAPGGRTYEYVVQLGESAEAGPFLIAGTHVESEGDYGLARALLDEMMRRMGRGDPPPGASSANPPIEAPSISASDESGDFRLELVVEQDRYRAGQPILADATMTYIGPASSIGLLGSGTGIVTTSIRQLDGAIQQGGASTSDCVRYELLRDEPMHVPFSKSGGFADDDPLADFYRAFFEDPLLRLPAGRWEISASTGFYAGGEDCGDGEWIALTARVEVVIEP